MLKLPTFFAQNTLLWTVYATLLMVCGWFVISYPKMDMALSINAINSEYLDFFFKYSTNFGDFLLIGPIILLLVFVRYRWAMVVSASTLFSLIFTQFMKRVVWYDSMRPGFYFNDLPDIHYVEDVHLHFSHSFPSGHTAGAFALFIALALFASKPVFKMGFLLAAVLVGYSRMYLSQHFLVDVCVGSMLGTLSAVLAYAWFNSPRWLARTKLDGSLLKTLRRNTDKS